MTRVWRFVPILAGFMALVVRGQVFFTHQGELKAAPKMVRYYSKTLPSEDVAQQKLRAYRAQIEQAGGTITLVTLGMQSSSVSMRIPVTGQGQSTKAMTSQRGPALFVILPEGVDMDMLLPDAKDLAFRMVP